MGRKTIENIKCRLEKIGPKWQIILETKNSVHLVNNNQE